MTKIHPFRSDPIIRFLLRCTGGNMYVLAVLYPVLGFGACLGLALLDGSAFPIAGNNHVEAFEDHVTFVCIGLLLPLGMLMGIRFYERLRSFSEVFDRVVEVVPPATKDAYLSRIDDDLNRPWFFWWALGLSVLANVIATLTMTGKWYTDLSGVAWIGFRVYVTINFYFMIHVVFKGVAVVRIMRRLLRGRDTHVNLEPLSPDGAAGLGPLVGIISALNYCVCLMAVFVMFVLLLDSRSFTMPIIQLAPAIIIYPAFAGYLLLVPLLEAHRSLVARKTAILEALSQAFQTASQGVFSGKLGEEGIALEATQRLETIERLHRIASRLPEWPFNTKIAGKFIATAALPLLLSVLVEVLKQPLGLV